MSTLLIHSSPYIFSPREQMQFSILWFTLILRASEDYMRQWVSDPLSRSTELQFCLWNFFYIFLAFTSPLLLSFTTIRWGNTMHAKSYITHMYAMTKVWPILWQYNWITFHTQHTSQAPSLVFWKHLQLGCAQ